MKLTFDIKQIEKIVYTKIIPAIQKKRILTFQGPLGAGKTTLIKEILRQCNINEIVTSPTFTYVNTYQNDKSLFFNHFDLYRLDSLDSFLNLGFDEYFQQSIETKNSWNFVEWPEIIIPLLKENKFHTHLCSIYLNYDPNNLNIRTIEIL